MAGVGDAGLRRDGQDKMVTFHVTTTAVLSDLDDTLFDHLSCTREALTARRERYDAFGRMPVEALEAKHGHLLEELHLEVLAGRLTVDDARIQRFRRLFEDAGATNVAGARAAGLRAIWFNRFGAASPDPSVPEIRSLAPAASVLAAIFQNHEYRHRSPGSSNPGSPKANMACGRPAAEAAGLRRNLCRVPNPDPGRS